MTRSEAITAIETGKKITHDLFLDSEYVNQVEGDMYDAEGNYIMKEEFWKYRNGEVYDSGWSIYNL